MNRLSKSLLIFGCSLAIAACGDSDSAGNNANNGSNGGKADSFERLENRVELTGSHDLEIELDEAFQCEGSQFMMFGGWRNTNTQQFDFPTMRLNLSFAGGRIPVAGDVLRTSSNSAVKFDGIGYSTDDGPGCNVKVVDIFNEGRDGQFGIAVEFDQCFLMKDDLVVEMSGTASCVGQGFDLLFEPEPNNTTPNNTTPNNSTPNNTTPNAGNPPVQECSDDAYTTWMNDVFTTIDGLGSVIDADDEQVIAEALAQKPCDGFNEALYLGWVDEFETRLSEAGNIIDEDDQKRLDAVLATRPAPTTQAAYVEWFAMYEEVFRDVAPSNTATIDADESKRIELAQQARGETVDGDESYAAWFALASEYFRDSAPSSSATVDDDELALLTELARSKPVGSSGENFSSFLELWDEYIFDAIPSSGTMLFDEDERALLNSAAELVPGGGSDGAYIAWVNGFGAFIDHVGTDPQIPGRDALDTYLALEPCADDAQAADVQSAYAGLPSDLSADSPVAAMVASASPEACN